MGRFLSSHHPCPLLGVWCDADDNCVWGGPVGIAIGNDGSMFVTDDGSRNVWHITHEGKAA
jgi:glucose/arabinose dehydrogenase